VFAKMCIWLSTRNWKRLALGVSSVYLLVLVGVLGADLIYNSTARRASSGRPALPSCRSTVKNGFCGLRSRA
jgi:hypothetical protein